jgi:hypothetical protein
LIRASKGRQKVGDEGPVFAARQKYGTVRFMMILLFRAIVSVGAAALLAACSLGTAPAVALQTTPSTAVALGFEHLSSGLSGGLRSSNSSSPCDLTSAWYFHGPCKTFILPYSGKTLTFPAYRGLSLTGKLFPNTWGTDFAMGMGTSDTDITGKLYEDHFPVSGSHGATCIGTNLKPVACKGKGFLYLLFYAPPSGTGGGMPTFPVFHITNKANFSGTTCSYATLTWNGSWLWIETTAAAKPKNGSLTYKSIGDWGLNLEAGHFSVVAFYCT